MITVLLLGAVVSTSAFPFMLESINNCTEGNFACRNGHCISSEFRCDGNNNCADASDEENCDFILCKSPKYFRCLDKRCISNTFVCDGENDCADFSDEVNCESFKMQPHTNVTCQKGEWQCTDKLCIPEEWVCNGEPDCLDASDEGLGCSSNITCDTFKCHDGPCIPNEWRCDGHNDCVDKSDEKDCENHFDIKKCNMDERKFLCSNNKTCISLNKTCDGNMDCPDKSDEGHFCSLKTMSCSTHDCSHDCIQLPTGPKCLCPVGYHIIDDKHCQDINECEQYGICDQKCRNIPGSYECYCDTKYKLQEDKRNCKAIEGEAMMVFSTKTEIRAYTLTSEVYFSIAKHLKQVIGIDYDGQHIYWTNIYAEHESIVRSTEDGANKETLVTSGLDLPEDLAVDWLTGNIYFTDAERQHIGVCTNDGVHCTVLVNKDISKPRGIALNPAEGDMYWTDWGKQAEIAYSLMDGTNDKSFVSEDIHWPNGLAIDYPNQRLYWTDARKMSLESIRLDGTDRRIVLEGVVKHPYAIGIFENRLYWSDWATHSIQSCDKFSGKNHHTIIKEAKEYIYGLSIFHSALHVNTDNPCARAYCSDMCLLKGKDYSCACPQDKEMSRNGHVCNAINKKQLLILGVNNMLIHVEHQLLGKHEITVLPIVVKTVGCLSFNSINNVLLISDLEDKKIISTHLNTGITKVLDINGLEKVTAMDYDPMGNNLYICDESRALLEVVSLNTMSKKILLHDLNGEVPESIVLVPDDGVMFISLKKRGGRSSHIDRFSMDGTGRTSVIDSGLEGPISLTYDVDLHRIFYADAGTGNIDSINVEGTDKRGFRYLSTSPIGLTTLNQDIFWINENSRRLFWAQKNSTLSYNKKITLDIPGEIGKLHLTSATLKKAYKSVCHRNNGNCSHLCLMTHKTVVCACPIGWELSENKQTCFKREHCNATEYLCPHSRTCILQSLRCNGHVDCAFGGDEEGCEKVNKCVSGYFQCGNGDCIKEQHVCDHNYDCKDKSDEHNCEEKDRNVCPPLHFSCGDGNCIAQRFVCDGHNDCKNNSDERNCGFSTCDAMQFRCDSGACIPKSWECDHEYDCTDLSDEHAQCSVTCSPDMHTCANGKCIDKKLVCDEVDNCGDNSDETLCYVAYQDNCGPDEFACSSNKSICLPNSAKCNETSECPHHEDEKDCSNCNVDEYTCDNKNCIPVQWLCDGMDDCNDKSDEKDELCSYSSQNGVISSVIHTSCENGFRCRSGHCIDLDLVCNGKHNCYDGSDEDGSCQTACEQVNNPCSQDCISTPSGPMCKCKHGYKLMGDGHTCQDIDECQNDPPVCSQICNNDIGSYICDCFDGYILRADKLSCKAEGSPMSLIFTSDNQIRILTQRTNSLGILYADDIPKISGLDTVFHSNHVYFSVETTGSIHRFDPKTKIRQYMEHIGQPKKISVDWSTENVYFYNAGSERRSISVCNFHEMLCEKLIDIDIHRQVSALTVDSVNKVMFYSLTSWWVFNNPSYVIYKCNLDGSRSHELVKSSTGYVTGLTFDLNKKHLYFVDQHTNQIGMVSYDGNVKSFLFKTQVSPRGLKFFENHLYYLTSGGQVTKCKLFDTQECENFKLHSYSSELLSIMQDSLQPKLENMCNNHTCKYLCLAAEQNYRCLCSDGSVVSNTEECSGSERDEENLLQVHSVTTVNDNPIKNNTGIIMIGVFIPIVILVLTVAIIFIIKRRNSGSLNISMRFHNPTYDNQNDDEKPILQPGQHEYTNPVHFNEDNSEIPTGIVAKKVNEFVVD